MGISGFGVTLSGASTGAIARIRNISNPGGSTDEIDTTTNDSTNNWKEFIAGLKDAGEVTVELLYGDDNCAAVQSAIGGSNEVWTITFPDGCTFTCSGFLKQNSMAIPYDDAMSQSVTIRFSGEPTFAVGS